MGESFVILGCSERKARTSRAIAAIDRYDGPLFRVFRKRAREITDKPPDACILSGKFGLIRGSFPVPRYDRQVSRCDFAALGNQVEGELKRILHEIQPERVFVSVGHRYWPLIEEPIAREVAPGRLFVATGGIGGRASQLAQWLRPNVGEVGGIGPERGCGEAVLLGTTVRLSRADVLRKARNALLVDTPGAHRFETWYVDVGHEHVAPKWLVSVLFEKPVARFRTADARRVLLLLGVPCNYAGRH